MSRGKQVQKSKKILQTKDSALNSVEQDVIAAIDAASPAARRESTKADAQTETPEEKPTHKSVWEKTEDGDLIVSENPLTHANKTNERDERRRQKKRIERLRKKYGLERMTERKEPLPISLGMRIWTIAEALALSAVWIFAFNLLYDRLGDIMAAVGLAVLFFGILFAMHVTRGLLESRRRYSVKPSASTIHYYMQMLHYDVRWWGLITFGVYAAMWFVERLVPISGTAMDVVYIACAAYLGYIWTTKYKGSEFVPFTYMETIFCFAAMLSNYFVFFVVR